MVNILKSFSLRKGLGNEEASLSNNPEYISQNPIGPQEIAFRQLTTSFAIDVSTSTRGRCLQQEIKAAVQIQGLLNPSKQTEARVLPWSGQAGPVISMQEINTIRTSFGTDPTVIYGPEQLEVLRKSSLWFLLTDGQIASSSVKEFAQQTLDHRIHGTACVIIIFGQTMKGSTLTRPAEADISVGMSVFALAADCLYLYHDILTNSDLVYILQAKGCFTKFLPKGKQLALTPNTTWNDLPRISYNDLANVKVPPPKKLAKNEIALENNLRINFEDMYSDNLDTTTVDAILDDPRSMTSLVQAEAVRGRSGELQTWLSRQSEENGNHYSPLKKISRYNAISSASERVSSIDNAPMTSGAWLSILPEGPSGDPYSYKDPNKYMKPPAAVPVDISRMKPLSDSGFKGRCMRCQIHDTLALVLKPPPELSTQGFPAENSMTSLAFPLAMGEFAETDIIAPAIYCEQCAEDIRNHPAKTTERITGVLHLTPYGENPEGWLIELSSGFQHRFSTDYLPQVFLAVCDAKIRRLSLDTIEQKAKTQILVSALDWVRSDILFHADMPMSMRSIQGPAGLSMSYSEMFSGQRDHYTMMCPLEAFGVYIRLEQDFHFLKWSEDSISNNIFQRLLLHLTESYLRLLEENGPIGTTMTLTPLLYEINDDWRMTMSFKDLKPASSIRISDLSKTELLSEESLSIFESLGDSFTRIKGHMASATALYLHYLVQSGSQQKTAYDNYKFLVSQEALGEVVWNPAGIVDWQQLKLSLSSIKADVPS